MMLLITRPQSAVGVTLDLQLDSSVADATETFLIGRITIAEYFSYNETGPSAVTALSRLFILQQPVCLAFLVHVHVLDTVIQTCHVEARTCPCDLRKLVHAITIHFVPYLRHSRLIPPSVTADGRL